MSFRHIRNIVLIVVCSVIGLIVGWKLLALYVDREAVRTVYFRTTPSLDATQMQTAQDHIATFDGILEQEVVDQGRALKVTFDANDVSAPQIRLTLECIRDFATDLTACVNERLASSR